MNKKRVVSVYADNSSTGIIGEQKIEVLTGNEVDRAKFNK